MSALLRRRAACGLLGSAVVAGLLIVPAPSAAAADGTIERISLRTGALESAGSATAPAVLVGGATALFLSDGSDLGLGDAPGPQLYVPITENDQHVAFPISTLNGEPAPGGVSAYDASDGADVVMAFVARADDAPLCTVAGAAADCADVYVQSAGGFRNDPSKITAAPDAPATDGDASEVRVSDVFSDSDGNPRVVVTYVSAASNLVAGDEVGSPDVFVVDSTTGETTRLTDGDVGGAMSGLAISADGSTVAVASSSDLDPATSTPGTHVFVIDLASGGITAVGLPGESFSPTLNGDGGIVTFLTDTALVEADVNGGRDAYLLDLDGGAPVLLSRGPDGSQVAGVDGAEISDDGSTVVFTGRGGLVPEAADEAVTYVYARQVATGAVQVANVPDSGQPAVTHGATLGPRSITADGSHVAFATSDPLKQADTNGTSDVYVRTLGDWRAPPPGTLGALTGEAVTLSTGVAPSEAQPIVLGIEVPAGLHGPLSVTPQPNDPALPTGYALFDPGLDTSLDIEGPQATAANPYLLTLTVDDSLLGGIAPADVQVFRNGSPVADCTGPGATPDPCVAGRAVGDDGDAVLTVRTSTFSTWSVGRLDYGLVGPLWPVRAVPGVNQAKAGLPVIVPFRLSGDRGTQVLAAGSPAVADCTGGAAAPLADGTWALTYLPLIRGYVFAWSTPGRQTGCREVQLQFRDGSELTVRFQLR